MTDPATLRALAKELCEAKEGSRELDLAIHKAVGRCAPSAWISHSGDCIQWYEVHEYGSGTASELMGDQLPHPYTTSLDAKIPGEDIVTVCAPGVQFAPKDRWYVRDRRALKNWNVGVAYAHTEPLARRAAALLAMAERMERKG